MKAIIPAAGLGTRLLPTTKAIPKELLPVNHKPAIQHVLEEAAAAGLKELIVVISPNKPSVREFLTPLPEGHALAQQPALAALETVLKSVKISFVEQPEALGLGDAVLRCQTLIGNEPFALLLPDNVCAPNARLTSRLLDVHRVHGRSCVAVRRIRNGASTAEPIRPDSSNGDICRVERVLAGGRIIDGSTELRGIGRYILEPAAFAYLQDAQPATELDEVPALDALAQRGRLLGLLVTEDVAHLGGTVDPSGPEDGRSRDPWKLDVPGHATLTSLHHTLRDEIKTRWQRSLPFADELFDRWERAAFLGFGPRSSIYDSSVVMGDVRVGDDTWIGPFTMLDGRGGLQIGCSCSISAGVHIYSHNTVKSALTGGKSAEARSATRIGNCCYIGPTSIISMGITIGDHSVVGANSFVREDIPPFSIAAGNPAHVIGRVELVGDDDARLVYFPKPNAD